MTATTAHHCHRQHRAYTALARCLWADAGWVAGTGPVALIAWCGVTSVTLHADVASAVLALEPLDRDGCGRQCVGDHQVLLLDLDEGTGRVVPR